MQARRIGLDREVVILGAVVVIGMIMAILDATIVNVAIPTLGAEFNTSISTIQWVMTAYLLALASTIPVSGWAGARFGTKPVWIASLSLFTLGSVPRRRGAVDRPADRRARDPGRRRRPDHAGRPDDPPARGRATSHRACDERRRHPDAPRSHRRAGDRRRDRRGDDLALDLPRQPARRRDRADARLAAPAEHRAATRSAARPARSRPALPRHRDRGLRPLRDRQRGHCRREGRGPHGDRRRRWSRASPCTHCGSGAAR